MRNLSVKIEAENVITMVCGIYSLKRVGRETLIQERLQAFLDEEKPSPRLFFEWDPNIETPSILSTLDCAECQKTNTATNSMCEFCNRPLDKHLLHRRFAVALWASFIAERAGLDLGCSSDQVMKHVGILRPYIGPKAANPNGLDWNLFVKQLNTIFTIIDVASNFGELNLCRKLFPDEYRVLSDQSYRHIAAQYFQFTLVAKMIWCLRIFRDGDEVPHIRELRGCLARLQKSDGGWGNLTDSMEYRVLNTVVLCKPMIEITFHGFGPYSPAVRHQITKALPSKWNSACSIESPRYNTREFDHVRNECKKTVQPSGENAVSVLVKYHLVRLQKWHKETTKSKPVPPAYTRSPHVIQDFIPKDASSASSSSTCEPKKRQKRKTSGNPVRMDDGTIGYEVEGIIDRKRVNGKLMYLIRWKGYDDSENTWEPLSNLEQCMDVVLEFDRAFERKQRRLKQRYCG